MESSRRCVYTMELELEQMELEDDASGDIDDPFTAIFDARQNSDHPVGLLRLWMYFV